MDMSQYLQLFIEESSEHLQNLNSHLLDLEKTPDDQAIVNEIFRAAHTLKGMAGTMGFTKMATLTHDMENVLQEVRSGNMRVNSNIVDVLFQCLDVLESYVDSVVNSGVEGDRTNEQVIGLLNAIVSNGGTASTDHNQPAAETQSEEPFLIDEYSQNIINQAANMGLKSYKITIKLNKGCVLKAARAFIVFKTLESNTDMIKSEPKVEDIEDEKFENEFTVAVVSNVPEKSLLKELNSIAEVDEVIVSELPVRVINASGGEGEREKQPVGHTTAGASNKGVNADKNTEQVTKPRSGKTVRVDIDRLDNLMNLASELIIIKTQLENAGISEKNQRYSESIEYLERITTSIHDAVMKVRMVPVEMVFNRFPRMIRDLARELGKQIELEMHGEETEVDRTVIDELGEPLIHLLRNSADHGIETPDKRVAKNKPGEGTITLMAYHDGNNVVIEVRDDGDGIDTEKVKRKAVEKGLIDEKVADELSQNEIIDFLFKPSFSTADQITDVSGRGVGLDVVKTKIEALGGVIEVETEHGKGSKFIIRFPLTLAIIQALMIGLGNEQYAIPLSSIKEIVDVKTGDIKLVQKKEVVLLRNQVIPLIRLDKMLDVLKDDVENKKEITVVIVKKGDKLFGFVVDELIGQQEIVIKSMSKHLASIKYFIGATILGDGQVALILDINTLAS